MKTLKFIRSAPCLMAIALHVTGCTVSRVDNMAIGLSTAALVMDWGQTRDAASEGWRRGREGGNTLLLGSAPNVGRVDVYFAMSAMVNMMLWLALPKGWKSIPSLGVIAIETPTVIDNRNRTMFLGFGTPPDPAMITQSLGGRR